MRREPRPRGGGRRRGWARVAVVMGRCRRSWSTDSPCFLPACLALPGSGEKFPASIFFFIARRKKSRSVLWSAWSFGHALKTALFGVSLFLWAVELMDCGVHGCRERQGCVSRPRRGNSCVTRGGRIQKNRRFCSFLSFLLLLCLLLLVNVAAVYMHDASAQVLPALVRFQGEWGEEW